jgi:hypothetical protein
MEDYDDGLGQAHQEDLLRQQELKRILVFFRLYMFYQGQQLTAEILYFKSMEVI